jgi:hypothetical protein
MRVSRARLGADERVWITCQPDDYRPAVLSAFAIFSRPTQFGTELTSSSSSCWHLEQR